MALFLSLPRELQAHATLLYQPYDEILRLCSELPELWWICSSADRSAWLFWYYKATSIPGQGTLSLDDFYSPDLPPRLRYLELATPNLGCTFESQKVADIWKCIRQVTRLGKLDVLSYYLDQVSELPGSVYTFLVSEAPPDVQPLVYEVLLDHSLLLPQDAIAYYQIVVERDVETFQRYVQRVLSRMRLSNQEWLKLVRLALQVGRPEYARWMVENAPEAR
jgi:hypothetical protein